MLVQTGHRAVDHQAGNLCRHRKDVDLLRKRTSTSSEPEIGIVVSLHERIATWSYVRTCRLSNWANCFCGTRFVQYAIHQRRGFRRMRPPLMSLKALAIDSSP